MTLSLLALSKGQTCGSKPGGPILRSDCGSKLAGTFKRSDVALACWHLSKSRCGS